MLSLPFSGFASGWFPAEKHRSDEGHAESCEDPGNPGHHAGAVQRDDEGDLGLTLFQRVCVSSSRALGVSQRQSLGQCGQGQTGHCGLAEMILRIEAVGCFFF